MRVTRSPRSRAPGTASSSHTSRVHTLGWLPASRPRERRSPAPYGGLCSGAEATEQGVRRTRRAALAEQRCPCGPRGGEDGAAPTLAAAALPGQARRPPGRLRPLRDPGASCSRGRSVPGLGPAARPGAKPVGPRRAPEPRPSPSLRPHQPAGGPRTLHASRPPPPRGAAAPVGLASTHGDPGPRAAAAEGTSGPGRPAGAERQSEGRGPGGGRGRASPRPGGPSRAHAHTAIPRPRGRSGPTAARPAP